MTTTAGGRPPNSSLPASRSRRLLDSRPEGERSPAPTEQRADLRARPASRSSYGATVLDATGHVARHGPPLHDAGRDGRASVACDLVAIAARPEPVISLLAQDGVPSRVGRADRRVRPGRPDARASTPPATSTGPLPDDARPWSRARSSVARRLSRLRSGPAGRRRRPARRPRARRSPRRWPRSAARPDVADARRPQAVPVRLRGRHGQGAAAGREGRLRRASS